MKPSASTTDQPDIDGEGRPIAAVAAIRGRGPGCGTGFHGEFTVGNWRPCCFAVGSERRRRRIGKIDLLAGLALVDPTPQLVNVARDRPRSLAIAGVLNGCAIDPVGQSVLPRRGPSRGTAE